MSSNRRDPACVTSRALSTETNLPDNSLLSVADVSGRKGFERIIDCGLLGVSTLVGRWVSAGRPALSPEKRALLTAAIAAAVEFLDLLDGDPDFEPSLGSIEKISQIAWGQGASCDGEDGDDHGIADSGGMDEQLQRAEWIRDIAVRPAERKIAA